MKTVKVAAWKCLRCDYVWVGHSRKITGKKKEDPPKRCPSCNSPYWKTERRRK